MPPSPRARNLEQLSRQTADGINQARYQPTTALGEYIDELLRPMDDEVERLTTANRQLTSDNRMLTDAVLQVAEDQRAMQDRLLALEHLAVATRDGE